MTPWPAGVAVHFEMSVCITAFGVENATRLSVVPLADAMPVKTKTELRSARKRSLRMRLGLPFLG